MDMIVFILCPVPNLKNNIDWSIHGEKLKDQIITELENYNAKLEQSH